MCGIAGVFLNGKAVHDAGTLQRLANSMVATLAHRGPDGEGCWSDEGAGIAFGFRRLAVMDPTPAGDQPMCSPSGRYRMMFNGEIYNFAELRDELRAAGFEFTSSGDTAVLIAAFDRWGIKESLSRLNGMFAIALWDTQTRALHLIRDRIGVKPLYWGEVGGTYVFASELRAILSLPDANRRINPDAEKAFLSLGYVPAPYSIINGIEKLPQGHGVTLRAGEVPMRWTWWSLHDELAEPAIEEDTDGTFERIFHDAVKRRARADVPVGAFLSGGYDSTAVLAALAATGHGDVQAYSIGFEDAGFDELSHAEAVASHLGFALDTRILTGAGARILAPQISEIYDEPFADASQFPMAVVSERARQGVTVAFSGDGGDELFAGYTRHLWADGLWRRLMAQPRWQRSWLAFAGLIAPGLVARMLPLTIRPGSGADGVRYVSKLLSAPTAEAWHARITSINDDQCQLPAAWFGVEASKIEDPMVRLRYLDFMRYLPDDILVKLDRASMAFGLEAREPFLDHQLVRFAFRLGREHLIDGSGGKRIVRDYVHRHVPEKIMVRPKQGFSVPLGSWLRGPLRDYAGDYLLGGTLKSEADAKLSHLWARHQSGIADHSPRLWAHVQFKAWRDRYGL